jgi:putative hemolysin
MLPDPNIAASAVPDLSTDLSLLAVLLVLNSVFSMAEMAVVTARKSKLKQLSKQSSRARAALELSENPERFLSTVQLAITLIDLLMGVVSGWIGIQIASSLERVSWLSHNASAWGLTLTLAMVTFVSIVFGELIPKRIALVAPEKIAMMVSIPMRWATRAVAPFVSVVVWVSSSVLKLLRLNQHSQSEVSEEEIQMLVAESNEAGIIDDVERTMVNRVLTLGERTVSSIMTPRPRVFWLDLEATLEENLSVMHAHKFSRYPVMRGSDKDVVGVVEIKSLTEHLGNSGHFDLFTTINKPVFVPEGMSALTLIEALRDAEVFMAFVVDEYGDLQGIATLNDVLHAVLGTSQQSHPSSPAHVVERADGSYWLDGALSIADLREVMDVQELPQEDEHDFNTLAGLLMAQFGRIPHVADAFDWRGWRFEVVDLDGARIDKVLLSRIETIR